MMYDVEINFSGFRGCTEVYTVEADTEDETEEEALKMAAYDLEVDNICTWDERFDRDV